MTTTTHTTSYVVKDTEKWLTDSLTLDKGTYVTDLTFPGGPQGMTLMLPNMDDLWTMDKILDIDRLIYDKQPKANRMTDHELSWNYFDIWL